MISTRPLLYSPRARLLLYGLALAIGLLLAWASAQQATAINPLPQRLYNSYHCLTPDSAGTQVRAPLRILDFFHLSTRPLADSLCNNPVIAAYYSGVEIIWMHRDQVDLRKLIDQDYELLFAKPELLERIESTAGNSYIPIVHYADYTSQLISLNSHPQLSNEYFRGKTLGLIDDPNSLSGYQIPKNALKQHQIDESTFEIVHYKSHDQLHRALLLGDVDVIASFSSLEHSAATSSKRTLNLQERLPGPHWYVLPELLDTAIHCQFEKLLRQYSRDVGNPYIANMTLARSCQHGK